MTTVYANLSYRHWLKRWCRKQYIIKPRVDIVSDGIIVASRTSYGVFDNKYKFVKSSFKTRGSARQIVPKFNHDDVDYIDADAVFVGAVHPHFGHFLLEHLNRSWVLANGDWTNKYIVFVNHRRLEKIPSFIYDFMALVGIKQERLLFINKPTRFNHVFVPSQSFDMRMFTSDAFKSLCNRIYENAVKVCPQNIQHDKIYVSRAKMGDRRTLGEEKVQSIFAKNGFEIIYPEQLNLAQQIATVGACKCLAGCAGTALHLALFMQQGKDSCVIQIKRNRRNKDSGRTQNLINKTHDIDGVFIAGSVETEKSRHYTDMPQIIGVTKYMKKFFDEHSYKYTDADVAPDFAAMQEYKRLVDEYNKTHGRIALRRTKRIIVKITSCFVPGRERRNVYRTWLKKKIKYGG